MKPFQTHRQQINILRGRGLHVDGAKAMRVLEQENYYDVINGYKDLFLQKDQQGHVLNPEQYISGATFTEIHNLYKFDRDLRNILLEYLLKFESSLKSKVSYRFSEKYKEPHAYLIMANYSRDPGNLKSVLGLIATISNTISRNGKRSTSIKHYLDKHDGVPLWVLVNYLTMGNMEFFYNCVTEPLQNEIAKDFSKAYKREYGTNIHITKEMVKSIIQISTFYRNVCAHEERLYSFKLSKPSTSSNISPLLNIPSNKLNKGNLFTVVSFLKLVLPKNEHRTLVRKLKASYTKYSTEFTSVQFSQIQRKMGFDMTWENHF